MEVYFEGYYGTGTVIYSKVHKSISRRMYQRLDIDFMEVYFEGYYGTGIRRRLR
jgi:hypothetical protein